MFVILTIDFDSLILVVSSGLASITTICYARREKFVFVFSQRNRHLLELPVYDHVCISYSPLNYNEFPRISTGRWCVELCSFACQFVMIALVPSAV